MPAVRAVLRAPHVGKILAASQIGRLPLGSAPLALLLAGRQSLSLVTAGLLVAAYTGALAICTPLLARAVDRWRQPPVLYGSATLSAIGFSVVVLGAGHAGLAVAGAALAGAGTPPLEACLRALWPGLVPPPLISAAYTLDIAVQEIIFVAGPLCTLAVVAATGPRTGVLAAAAFQLAGTIAFARDGAVRRWRGERASRHWAGPLRVLRFARLLAGVAGVGLAFGSIPVVVTGYAETAGNRSLAGWLLAAQAVGALAGGLLYTRAGTGDRRRLPALAGVLVLGFLPLLWVPQPPVLAVLLAISGLALPPVLTAVFLTADRLTPAGTAVEAFAWVATAFAVGSAAGSALTGPVVTAGIRAGFGLACVATLLAALVLTSVTRRGADS